MAIGALVVMLLWNVFVVSGTAYLIVAQQWSPWWFVLTWFLMLFPSKDDE